VRLAICLHGGAVARASLPLHPADRAIVTLGRRLGFELVAIELMGAPGLAPRAVDEALACGLDRAIRVIDDALAVADAPGTGLVTERALREVKADLVTFAAAAEPEACADVPAVVAFRMGTPYVPGVFELVPAAAHAGGGGAPSAPVITAWARRGGLTVSLEIPRGAVLDLGLEGDGKDTEPALGPPTRPASAIQVVTLSDLGLDATLVRRRTDLRGVIEPTSRPLVTTTSGASLADLLR
jgi:hypothetical protein